MGVQHRIAVGVVERKHRDAAVGAAEPQVIDDGVGVADEIGMTQQDAFGPPSGARGIENAREVATDWRRSPRHLGRRQDGIKVLQGMR